MWSTASATELGQRQAELNNGASLGDLRTGLAHTATAAYDINYLYQQVLGRSASGSEVAGREADLAGGQSLNGLRGSLSQTGEAAGNIAYRVKTELGRTAGTADIAYWEGRLAADTSLFALQMAYAYSEEGAAQIQDIYQGVIGRTASDGELGNRQADLNGGASLNDLRWSLSQTNEAVASIQVLYVQVLGRTASTGEISDRQNDLVRGQTLAGLRASLAQTGEAASDIKAIFQTVAGRTANPNEVAAYQQVLATNVGWTLALVGPAVATAEINRFYQQLFGRDAAPTERSDIERALASGQSLQSQFSVLRPQFATSSGETGIINEFYQGILGRDATGSELTNIEGALSAGQSLLTIEGNLTPDVVKQIEAFYQQDLGRRAAWPELSFWEGQLQAGKSLGAVGGDIAYSQESVTHIQTLFQQDFGRYASLNEVQGWQAAEASQVPPGSQFTVSANGTVLAIADARTIVAETGAYVTLAGGLTPTLTGPDGQVVTFRTAAEFAAYALCMACRAGQGSPAALQTYNLTQSWLVHVDQACIQAASNLQAKAQADTAAGRQQQGYLEAIGAQMAMKIQQTAPDQRQPLSVQVMIGQTLATVYVTGNTDDPTGLAGFGYTLVDTDPGRTALIAQAQAAVAAGAGAGAAGNQLLAFLDDAQARVDLAYAALPASARTDRMLAVAQQFVDAGQAAAGVGNWNLVQTLETAADVSLQIAAQPEGSRTAVTERFVHKGTKHDITVDPNAADPFASFKDHSKGEDVVGAIVEGVVGVVLNVLAVIPVTAPIAAPLAIAWDTAQAGQSFADGNVLGGFLNLAAAAGVGLSGLGAASANGAGATAGSFASNASQLAGNVATSLGFTSATTAASFGRQILEGAALVGGAAGIAQSAANSDLLGIAAGVLEVTAAVAGGLLSVDQVASNAALSQIAKNVAIYGGLASVAASSADAFARGDLAGGLASSLNVLLSQVAQQVGERAGPADRTIIPAPGTVGDDLPLPVPPIPPEQPTGTLVATDQTLAASAGAIPGTDYITFTPSQATGVSPVGILGNLVGKLFRVSGLALNVANVLFESSPAGFAPQQGAGALPDGVVLPYSQSEGYVTVFTPSASGTLTNAGGSGVLLDASGNIAGVRLQVGSDGSLVTLGGSTVGYISDAAGIRISSTFLSNIVNSNLNIAQATVPEILAGSTPDPDKPVLMDGTLQQVKPGGMADADADFDSLQPSNVQNAGDGVRVGTLADGTQVVVRPKSIPSLEINLPSGPSYVIRYR